MNNDLDRQVAEALQSLPQEEIQRRRVASSNLEQSWLRWKAYYQSAWDSMVHAHPFAEPAALVQMSLKLADAASGAVDERVKDHIQKKFVLLTTGQDDIAHAWGG